MFNFFKKENKKKQFLVLSIGKMDVKGVLANKENDKIEIKKVFSRPIERFGVFETRDFNFEIIKRPIQEIIKFFNLKKIEDMVAVLGFPVGEVNIQIVNVQREREKDKLNERITKKEKEEIYKEVYKEAKEKFEKIFTGDKNKVKFLAIKILEEKIMGYKVSSIVGLRGSEMNFKVLLVYSLGISEFVDKFKKAFNFQDVRISHCAEGMINLAAKDKESKIFIRVSDNDTQILFFNGELEAVYNFSLGIVDLSTALADKFGLTEQKMMEIENDFFAGKLSKATQTEIQEAIQPVLAEWLKKFIEVKRVRPMDLDLFYKEAFIFGGGNFLYIIDKYLREQKKNIPFLNQAEKIKILSPSSLGLEFETKEKISPKYTTSLMLTFTI